MGSLLPWATAQRRQPRQYRAHEGLRSVGLNVVALEYRRVRRHPGEPSEASVTEDDGRRLSLPPKDTLGIPADQDHHLRLVARIRRRGERRSRSRRLPAVILEGAPASLVAIGERRYPWIPIRAGRCGTHSSPSCESAASRLPMLFIHSPEDQIIPIEQGRKLFNAAT